MMKNFASIDGPGCLARAARKVRLRPGMVLLAGMLFGLSGSLGRGQVSTLNENFGDGSGDGNTVVLPSGWTDVKLTQSAATSISSGLPGPWSSYSTSADGAGGL